MLSFLLFFYIFLKALFIVDHNIYYRANYNYELRIPNSELTKPYSELDKLLSKMETKKEP